MRIRALDFGAGNFKAYGHTGGHLIPTQVATASGIKMGRVAGLRSQEPPTQITIDGHRFYVGSRAHDWGRPIENLDNHRFISGSPDMRAMVYASLSITRIQEPLHLIVGLPQSALADDNAQATADAVRAWLTGTHTWTCNNVPRHAEVEKVTLTSQAAGALFDYLLDDQGEFLPQRKPHFRKELGILSVGMNTLELLGVRDGRPINRFTHSVTAGVRRLLELADPAGVYSRGELDIQLRTNQLDVADVLPVWASEVAGHVERAWGTAHRRFAAVIVVGGGALLLHNELLGLFNGKSYLPEEPVLAVARGLYKLARLKS